MRRAFSTISQSLASGRIAASPGAWSAANVASASPAAPVSNMCGARRACARQSIAACATSTLAVFCGGNDPEKAATAFALYDRDGSGDIEPDEMTAYLEAVFKAIISVDPGAEARAGGGYRAIAASTALPPAIRMRKPATEASGWAEAIMPRRPVTVGR